MDALYYTLYEVNDCIAQSVITSELTPMVRYEQCTH